MAEPEPTYLSPRWSYEVTDCSMPMSFDTYSVCSFNCLYCFSFFQKSHSVSGYLEKRVRSVNVEAVKKLFMYGLTGDESIQLSEGAKDFRNYVKNRKVMQWGGLCDPFDENEEKYGVSLELLRFFDEIDYPLSISTKGVFWTKDERYMSLFRKHTHNWHVKVSIITADGFRAAAIERGGCPSPNERLEAIRRLSEIGIHVTLRLRPYIIGVSDDYRNLIQRAHEMGADSVTTEFFCLEARANARLKQKYVELGTICGYDPLGFYREHTPKGSGLLRLNYAIKAPIIRDMQRLTHQLGMRFYVSDAHHKERSDHCCCCGVPPEWNVSRGHFAQALQIAKKNGQVSWSDIQDEAAYLLAKPPFSYAQGYNAGGTKRRAQHRGQSLYDWLRELWNTPKQKNSPYNYFAGALVPIGVDKDKNVVYKYNRKAE